MRIDPIKSCIEKIEEEEEEKMEHIPHSLSLDPRNKARSSKEIDFFHLNEPHEDHKSQMTSDEEISIHLNGCKITHYSAENESIYKQSMNSITKEQDILSKSIFGEDFKEKVESSFLSQEKKNKGRISLQESEDLGSSVLDNEEQ